MSFEAINYVLKHSRTVGSARVLMLVIANRTNEVSKKAWPSRPTLAADVNVGSRHITALIAECERMGELVVIPKIGKPHDLYIAGYGNPPEDKARPAPEKKDRKWPTPATSTTSDTGNTTDTSSNSGVATSSNTPLLPVAHNPLTNPKDEPKVLSQPPFTEYFGAICEAFGFDPKRLTRKERNRIGGVAKEISEAGYEPSAIGITHAYCVASEFSNFTVNALAVHVSAAMLEYERKVTRLSVPTQDDPAEEPFERITPERRKALQAEFEKTMADIAAAKADLPHRVARQQLAKKVPA
jgi:hypothetical protein